MRRTDTLTWPVTDGRREAGGEASIPEMGAPPTRRGGGARESGRGREAPTAGDGRGAGGYEAAGPVH